MIVAEYEGPPDPYLTGERIVIPEGSNIVDIIVLTSDYPNKAMIHDWRIYSEGNEGNVHPEPT